MSVEKKSALHPRNLHQERYDLALLCCNRPDLKRFIKKNPSGQETIDFASPEAVLSLNQALLASYYNIQHWFIPAGYLCPPIPGRADYVHYAADLLKGIVAEDQPVKVLDIGTGANLIYPIIGSQVYGWRFVASDIDPVSVKSAQLIVDSNKALKGKVKVHLQKDAKHFFHGIIKDGDYFEITLCNPPFHASLKEAQAGTERKWKNLNRSTARRGGKSAVQQKGCDTLNFGGQKAELWCEGGEIKFLRDMVKESANFAEQVGWFTSLVSRKENIFPLKKLLQRVGAKQVEVVEMSQGQKVSRMLAWSFMARDRQETHFHENF